MTLSTIIILALAIGAGFGAVLHERFPMWVVPLDHYLLDPLGQAFLRLIQFVVVPIVFSSLVLGLTRIQNAAEMGRYTAKLLSSYVITSVIAVLVGLGAAILFRPGVGLTGLVPLAVMSSAEAPDLIDWLVNLIPTNPLMALSTSNLLQTIISGALIGVGIQRSGKQAEAFVAFIESVYAISEKILFLILYLAPLGVFALMASVIAQQGVGILVRLLDYMIGVVFSIGIMIGFYTLVLVIIKGRPLHFFQSFYPSLSLAFGTASSNAALPVSLQNAKAYGMSETVASFAIPLGTALKRDGMAAGQAFNAIFVAQLYDIPMTPSLLLSIALSTILVSFSTAGVPGAGIVMMTTIFTAAGLPLEGVAILAGVDRLMDSFHTLLNVIGNIVNAVILERWEGPSELLKLEEVASVSDLD
jgi:proton glutamate symport protein